MNKEEIENYIAELESMFELSELEEHSRNILRVGNYIKQLQQENKQLKEELKYTVPIVEHNKIVSKKLKENQKYKEVIDKAIDKLQLLIDIGFDYDGFNQADSLKTLIDELVGYAKESRKILKEVEETDINVGEVE